jgi:hypothetical protein
MHCFLLEALFLKNLFCSPRVVFGSGLNVVVASVLSHRPGLAFSIFILLFGCVHA